MGRARVSKTQIAALQNAIRTGQRFSITGNGLQPVGKVEIKPMHCYFMGASSSPDWVIVIKLDDKFTHYKRFSAAEWSQHEDNPDKLHRCENWIFQSLVSDATKTITKQWNAIKDVERPDDKLFYFQKEGTRREFELLDGKPYQFEPRVICNCCGDDTTVNADNRSTCCDQDYRTNRDITKVNWS